MLVKGGPDGWREMICGLIWAPILHVSTVHPRIVPTGVLSFQDHVIKWKRFPRYWPFVRGIHRSLVKSPHKGQWRGALMFSLICAWMNGWVNNREAGDLRPHRTYHGVIVMCFDYIISIQWSHVINLTVLSRVNSPTLGQLYDCCSTYPDGPMTHLLKSFLRSKRRRDVILTYWGRYFCIVCPLGMLPHIPPIHWGAPLSGYKQISLTHPCNVWRHCMYSDRVTSQWHCVLSQSMLPHRFTQFQNNIWVLHGQCRSAHIIQNRPLKVVAIVIYTVSSKQTKPQQKILKYPTYSVTRLIRIFN